MRLHLFCLPWPVCRVALLVYEEVSGGPECRDTSRGHAFIKLSARALHQSQEVTKAVPAGDESRVPFEVCCCIVPLR
jgi:hypothetical protein